MRVALTGQRVTVTEIVRRHAEEKAERFDKYVDGVRNVRIVLAPEGDRYRAEAIVQAARGNNFIGRGIGRDLCAAIDGAAEKIEHQLARYKGKTVDRKGKRRTREIAEAE